MLYGTLVADPEQIEEVAAESKLAEIDPDDFPLGATACNLGEECKSCQ